MAGYYDALIAKWPSVSGATTADKLAALNAETVAGPNTDVAASTVVGTLMLNSAFLTLQTFSQGATSGDPTHDTALMSAKMLMAVINTPNAPTFQMSDATKYAQIKGMMDAILAEEIAVPGTTGFTQTVHDALLALAATTMPWWASAGYPRPFDMGDIQAAGLS